MAIPGYMWITDDEGNEVKGNAQVEGREGSIEVSSLWHEVRIPTDRDTGALTSTRKHEPFTIKKEFDSATPVLNKACSSGQTLQQVKVSWYRINQQGQEEEYFRHTLTNAKVVSVKPVVEDIKDSSKENQSHFENVAFRYERIHWNYLDGNIATSDQWNKKQ